MDETLAWLFLLNATNPGTQRLTALLEAFGTAENIIRASDADLRCAGVKPDIIKSIRRKASPEIRHQQQWLQQPGHYLLPLTDPGYPQQLKHIPDPPPALFVEGDPEVLSCPHLAIVGSRNPGRNGRDMARLLASQLADTGLVISSGLAAGIDASAHEGALETGRTTAVLGNGTDIIYPAHHRGLAERVVCNGALVSEFPPGTPPLARHFPRRNRIISGLSLGVLVVEAALKSGSLITARCALEQGREVFAIPGPVQSPLSRGCHYLIRQGARLVETVVDVLEEIHPEQLSCRIDMTDADVATGNNLHVFDDDEVADFMQHLTYSPQTLDELVESSGLTAEKVSSMLLIMEVQGIISSAGGQYTRIN